MWYNVHVARSGKKTKATICDRVNLVYVRLFNEKCDVVGLPFGRGVKINDVVLLKRKSSKKDETWRIDVIKDKRRIDVGTLVDALSWIHTEILS